MVNRIVPNDIAGDSGRICCKHGRTSGKNSMETPYDWTTIIVFAGLIVLFLQRSQGTPRDHLWQYLVAALGCMGTNYLGNEAIKQGQIGYHFAAVGLFVATLAFIWFALQPFGEPHD
jgi:hypothetical protein